MSRIIRIEETQTTVVIGSPANADAWYGPETNVYISVPDAFTAWAWWIVDHIACEEVITISRNGRTGFAVKRADYRRADDMFLNLLPGKSLINMAYGKVGK